MTFPCGKVESTATIHVESVDVGMSIKEELDASMLARQCCKVERCAVVAVGYGIDIGISIKEELDALMTALPCCKVQRSAGIQGASIDIGVSIKKRLHLCN